MIIFKDIVTGDELFSDSFIFKEIDCFYYIDAKNVRVGSEDIDDSLLGGNKSAEGEDEGISNDPNSEMKIDVVHRHRLTETGFSNKKQYGAYMKKLLVTIKEHLIKEGQLKDEEDAIKAWQENVKLNVKKHILDVFSDLQFFMGESLNGEGTLMALNYEGDNPKMIVMMDAVIKEKV